MSLKKLLLIVAFVLVTAALGFAVYFVFFRAPAAPPTPPPEVEGPPPGVGVGLPPAPEAPPRPPEAPGELPPGVSRIAQGGLTLAAEITSKRVGNATVSLDGRIQFYDQETNKFYRVTADGELTPLSNQQFFNVQEVSWAPNAQKAVIEYPDGSKIAYDFVRETQFTLPRHWDDFSFSPDGDKFAAKSLSANPDNRWLIVSNYDGTGAQAIEPMGDNSDKVNVSWSPNNQVAAFSRTGPAAGFDRQNILLVGLKGENFKALTVEGRGFESAWSPAGDRIIYSVYSSDSGYRPLLWTSLASGDNIGANRANLGLNTWAGKCAFSANTVVFCAVPASLPEGAGLQPEVAQNSPDFIYRLDLQNGQKTLVAQPDGNFPISKLMTSPDGKYLFLVDGLTGMLKKIQLK